MVPAKYFSIINRNSVKERIWHYCLTLSLASVVCFTLAIVIRLDNVAAPASPNVGLNEVLAGIKTLLFSFSAALVSAVTSVTIYRRIMSSQVEEELLVKGIVAATLAQEELFQGLVDCNIGLSEVEIREMIETSDVDIVNTFINTGVLYNLEKSFRIAFDRGKLIRIALLHPASDFVSSRAGEHAYSFSVEAEIMTNLTVLQNLYQEWKLSNNGASPRLEVYCYDRLPMAAYMGPEFIQIGFFLHRTVSSRGPQCKFKRSSGTGALFAGHLSTYFKSYKSLPVDLNNKISDEMKKIELALRAQP